MRLPCRDCNIDTSTKTGIGEYYHVHDLIWYDAFGHDHSATGDIQEILFAGYLCIGCLETRLGRPLTSADFSTAPVNDPTLYRKSQRFIDRIDA